MCFARVAGVALWMRYALPHTTLMREPVRCAAVSATAQESACTGVAEETAKLRCAALAHAALGVPLDRHTCARLSADIVREHTAFIGLDRSAHACHRHAVEAALLDAVVHICWCADRVPTDVAAHEAETTRARMRVAAAIDARLQCCDAHARAKRALSSWCAASYASWCQTHT